MEGVVDADGLVERRRREPRVAEAEVEAQAEAEAAQDFMEFERTTKVSISTKKATKTADQSEKAATVTEISDAMSDLKEEQTLLDKALQELEELRPACIDTGMSFAERVAKREEEIEALKKAVCLLDPEQVEDQCK